MFELLAATTTQPTTNPLTAFLPMILIVGVGLLPHDPPAAAQAAGRSASC